MDPASRRTEDRRNGRGFQAAIWAHQERFDRARIQRPRRQKKGTNPVNEYKLEHPRRTIGGYGAGKLTETIRHLVRAQHAAADEALIELLDAGVDLLDLFRLIRPGGDTAIRIARKSDQVVLFETQVEHREDDGSLRYEVITTWTEAGDAARRRTS